MEDKREGIENELDDNSKVKESEQYKLANDMIEEEIDVIEKYQAYVEGLSDAFAKGNKLLEVSSDYLRKYGSQSIISNGQLLKVLMSSHDMMEKMNSFLSDSVQMLTMFSACKEEFVHYLEEQREKEKELKEMENKINE